MEMNQQQDHKFPVELAYVPFFNLALQQNAVPVNRRINTAKQSHDAEFMENDEMRIIPNSTNNLKWLPRRDSNPN